jgi:hypothetical protein
MASTYVNDLRLNEMATGDQSGSWGTVTNTNLELIAEAFSYGTEAITTNADTHTTTIADGGTDPGRSMFLKYTGTLDSACTITIGPNTVSKLWFIENATSGSQNIIIKQGSGATVTIASGKTKVIYSDGVGSGAKMVDAFAALDVGSVSVDNITIDGNEIDVSSGNLTLDVAGELILDADADGTIRFNDNGTNFGMVYGASSNFTLISKVQDKDMIFQGNDGGSTITALTLDMSLGGSASFNHDIQMVDNGLLRMGAGGDLILTSDGTNGTIFANNGNLTLDVAGNIVLDADNLGVVQIKDGGTIYGTFFKNGDNFFIESNVSDGDLIFRGNDGGSNINALTLDMSNGGQAVFNKGASFQDHVYLQDNDKLVLGNSDDLQIYHDGGSGNYIDSVNKDLYLRCNLDAGIAGGDIILQPKSGENSAVFRDNGAVELYHDNSKKIETTSTGATIRGDGDAILLLNTASDGGDKSLIRFGDNGDADAGYIDYDHGDNTLRFGVNAAERLRINGSGRQTYNGSSTANGHGNFVGEVGTSSKAIIFEHTNGGGEVGSIRTTSSNAVYYGDGSNLTGVGGSTDFNAVGTYTWLAVDPAQSVNMINEGDTISGSYLKAAGNGQMSAHHILWSSTVSAGVSGTWRLMGGQHKRENGSYATANLFVRIS